MASYLTPDWLMQDIQSLIQHRPGAGGTTLERTGTPGAHTYDVEWRGGDYKMNPLDVSQSTFDEMIGLGYNPMSFSEFAKSIYDQEGGSGRHRG